MRTTLLALFAAVAASAASIPGREGGNAVPRAIVPPPVTRPRAIVPPPLQDYARAHARAHRSGNNHGSRRLVRRKRTGNSKRARKCRPKTTGTDDSHKPTDTASDWSASATGTGTKWDEATTTGEPATTKHGEEGTATPTGKPTTTDDGENGTATPTGKPTTTDDGEEGTATPTGKPTNTEDGQGGTTTPTGTGTGNTTKPTDSGSTAGGGGSSNLLPLGRGLATWSTCPKTGEPMSFDQALLPLQFGKLPSSSNAPDGSESYVQVYPAGQYGKGFSFYTGGDKSGIDMTKAKDVVFSYEVWFDGTFDFVKGGKLPGLYGGSTLQDAKSCSGGRSEGRDSCFSCRLMWRTNGAGEVYNYLPTSAQNSYCGQQGSVCNPSYGDSVGRGAYSWDKGRWVSVAHRVKLNDIGQKNGEQQLWVDGQKAIDLNGLELRTKPETVFQGIMAQTFFGGSGSDWAPPSDQTAYFKSWTLSVHEYL